MKIAAIGDIHGNNRALEAALEYLEEQKIEHVLFLGDFITDCPGVRETLSLLGEASKSFNAFFVRGNREDYMLDYSKQKEPSWFYGSKYGSLLYSFDRLTREDLDWFESLPIGRKVRINSLPEFEMCHGSMKASRFLALPGDTGMEEMFLHMETDLLFCAHSHTQFICTEGNRTVINGGSVGVPTKGSTFAELAVSEYTGDGWKHELVKIKYDIDALVNDFYTSGFIEKANVWARAVLATVKSGHHYTFECLDLVEDISKATGCSREDEAVWEKAASILGI